MYLFLIDDAQQRNCSRDGVRELSAIGGIIVPASTARDLDDAVARVCGEFGFPDGEPFKWSPSAEYWMRERLTGENRTNFFRAVLTTARGHGALAQVAMVEPNWGRAVAQTPTMDAMALALERFDNFLRVERQSGVVIAAKPGGGARDEDAFWPSA